MRSILFLTCASVGLFGMNHSASASDHHFQSNQFSNPYGGYGAGGTRWNGSGIYSGSRNWGSGYRGGYQNSHWQGGRHNHGGVQWHDTSHLHYQPGYLVPHYNHYHYVPGQYHLHQTGHWDVRHGNHWHHGH